MTFEFGIFSFERFTSAGVTGAPPKIMKSSDLNKFGTFVTDKNLNYLAIKIIEIFMIENI